MARDTHDDLYKDHPQATAKITPLELSPEDAKVGEILWRMPVTPTSYKHNSQLIGFSGSYPTANPLPVVLRGSERACIYHQVCLPSFVSLLDDVTVHVTLVCLLMTSLKSWSRGWPVAPQCRCLRRSPLSLAAWLSLPPSDDVTALVILIRRRVVVDLSLSWYFLVRSLSSCLLL